MHRIASYFLTETTLLGATNDARFVVVIEEDSNVSVFAVGNNVFTAVKGNHAGKKGMSLEVVCDVSINKTAS
jgi:hypothetical protein